MANSEDPEPVHIQNASGDFILELCPPPSSVTDLKLAIEDQLAVPVALQRILHNGCILPDGQVLQHIAESPLMLVIDETPLAHWELAGNPDRDQLQGQLGEVTFANPSTDYVIVLTQEPVRSGRHYFEFVMHAINDEQWCGVATDKRRCGHDCGESIYCSTGLENAWFYYCGRRRDDDDSELSDSEQDYCNDGPAGLHFGRERFGIKRFEYVANGDVIGMLLDLDVGILAFALNGRPQGACAVPSVPMYVSTCLDRENDHVELKMPQEAPPELVDLLSKPLIEPPRPKEALTRSSSEEEELENEEALVEPEHSDED